MAVDDRESAPGRRAQARRARWWYLLLLPPFIGLLYPPLYAHRTPELLGFPFFYWYQFAWVPIAAILTWTVYVKTRRVP
jgi:Protein of unknown function (DUF3311)